MPEDTYYKLLRGAHTRWEGTVTPDPEGKRVNIKEGAFVRYAADSDNSVMANLSAKEIKALGDRIQVTTAPKVKGGGAAKEEETDANVEAFTALNAPEAIEYVGESDDLPELKKLLAAEKAGKNRVTVVKALEERIDDLGGDLV